MHTRLFKHQADIIKHVEDVVEDNDFNRFLTFSFVHSKAGVPLGKSDVAQINRLIQIYLKKISYKLNGRPRKRQKDEPKPVAAIAIPEYKVASGGNGHLHFHCLIKIPDRSLNFFYDVTNAFWRTVLKNSPVYPPKIHTKDIYDGRGLARYVLKTIEDGFTLENAIVSGLA